MSEQRRDVWAVQGTVRGTVETSASDAREAIAALREHEAWAIIRRSTRAGDRDTVGLVGGRRRVVESVLDVPLEDGPPNAGHVADRLLAIPFRQVAERGFEAHDDGTPLVVVDVESEREFTVAAVVEAIDDTGVELADRGGFETDDDEYAKLVEAVITDEIGQGEGANLVIGRHYRATVADCCSASAAPTGPSCSSPASATSSAPVPSGTSPCTATTCG
jgi:2-amino-4-deoxychorismate synthase